MEPAASEFAAHRIDRAEFAQLAGTLRAGAAATLTALLCTVAPALFLRRLTGHLTAPLDAGRFALAAVLLVLAAVAVGRLLPRRGRLWAVARYAAVAALSVTLAAVSLPGTPSAALAFAWLLALAATGDVLAAPAIRLPRRAKSAPRATESEPTDVDLTADVAEDELADEELSAWQQMSRRRTTEAETVTGWVRVVFAPLQRRAAAHLAFCPPLDCTPRIDCAWLDGPEARVTPAEVLAYGARLDLALVDEFDEPVEVTIGFEVTADCEGSHGGPDVGPDDGHP